MTQTKDAQTVKIRFRLVFCKVLPEWGRYERQKSIPYHHVEHLIVYHISYVIRLIRLSESASAAYTHECPSTTFAREPVLFGIIVNKLRLGDIMSQCRNVP